jgi:hypothetical protein
VSTPRVGVADIQSVLDKAAVGFHAVWGPTVPVEDIRSLAQAHILAANVA